MIEHNKIDFLYKYVSLASLEKIIRNYTFLCRSPILFNDPFDSNIENILSFGSMVESTINALCSEKFSLLCAQEKEGIKLEIIEQTTLDVKNSADYITVNNLLNRSAILCLSSVYDNILMWSHYADSHKGAVIELDLNESRKKNSWISEARPVKYSNNNPTVILEVIYTKAELWNYEQEWRVNIATEFKDYEPLDSRTRQEKFYPTELSSITFGLKTEKEQIDMLLKDFLSRPELSHLKIYQMKRCHGRFEIERKLFVS